MDWHLIIEQAALLLIGALGGGAGTAAMKNRTGSGTKLNLFDEVRNHEMRILKIEAKLEAQDG